MATKTAKKPAAAKKPATASSATAPKTKAAPKLSRLEAHEKAVAAVEASLDADGEKLGESVILELRNEFDKVKHHLPWRELFARARYAPEAKAK
jgi:hypothetical protein